MTTQGPLDIKSQSSSKNPFAGVNCVKALSLLSRLMDQFQSPHLKASCQNAIYYLPMVIGAHCVGLDYSKC
jgi:hypothetical protein